MAPQFSIRERTFLACCHLKGLSWIKIQDSFREKFPNSRMPSRMTVHRLAKKFKDEGSVHNLNKMHSGRPRSARTVANIDRVRLLLNQERDLAVGFFRSSARRNNLMVSKSTFNRITRLDLKHHPYVVARHCHLSDRAKQLRITMAQFLIRQPHLFYARLLVTDEATFTLGGHVFNRRMTVCYSQCRQGRPEHFFSESVQSPPKVMTFLVVCGDGQKFGPFFYESTIKAATYRRKLED